MSKIKLTKEVEFYSERLAALTPGMSGADIANVCNEGALVAARTDKESVDMVDFETVGKAAAWAPSQAAWHVQSLPTDWFGHQMHGQSFFVSHAVQRQHPLQGLTQGLVMCVSHRKRLIMWLSAQGS